MKANFIWAGESLGPSSAGTNPAFRKKEAEIIIGFNLCCEYKNDINYLIISLTLSNNSLFIITS